MSILGYAKSLNVPIEVMVNTNRAARWDFGGRIYTDRQIRAGVRGRFAELLAKAIDRGALDRQLSQGDRTALRQLPRLLRRTERARRLHARRPVRLCRAAGRI